MKSNNHKKLAATLMTAVLAGSVVATSITVANANTASGTPEEQADITNWIANTPQQISNHMAMQHIDTNNLNGAQYVIQWGDTLSGISSATGISVAKLCYDNNIQNADLIYAGDILILNRTGNVPAGYVPNVNPDAVAQTKVTINNGPTNVNINVQPHAVQNIDNSTHIYKAGGATTDNDDAESDSSSSHSTKTTKVTASAIVDGLEDANTNDKLSFEVGDGGSDADELDIDSAALLKDAKKGDYDAVLDAIEDALDNKDDNDVTIYIEKDGGELHVYASQDDEESSSEDSSSAKDSSDDSESSQSSSDEDSDSQAVTNEDEDTDTSDVAN